MYVEGKDHIKRLEQFGKKLSENTIKFYRNYMNLIVEKFGSLSLEDLTIPLVNDYLITLDKSGSWKNSYLDALGQVYKEAPWHCKKAIVKPDFPRFSRNSKKADIFTKEELERFFDGQYWDDFSLRDYLLFLLLVSSGLRLGEGRAVRVNQIIPESKCLIVDGFCKRDGTRTNYNKKGNDEDTKLRVTLIPDATLDTIMNYIKHHGYKDNDYVFQMDDGTPIPQDHLELVFKTVLKLSKIDTLGRRLVPHSFRFTYVTRMRRNITGETVRKLVGHADCRMTDYYTRSTIPEMVEGIKDALPAANSLFR